MYVFNLSSQISLYFYCITKLCQFYSKEITSQGLFHKCLLQKNFTLSNGVSKDVDPINIYVYRVVSLLVHGTTYHITCLLVALCLAIVSLICLTSALVTPPMTNKMIQSLLAGRGKAELINRLYIVPYYKHDYITTL